MSELSFISVHKIGIVLAALSGFAGFIVNGIYQSILAPLQASVAADQLEDSTASWVLHYQTSYGDLIPNLIIGITVISVFLFLLPTIKHAIRLAKTD